MGVAPGENAGLRLAQPPTRPMPWPVSAAPPLPQRAAAPVDVVHVAHVAPAQVLHHAREVVGPLCGTQQMHVIGHQHISVDAATVLFRRLVQPIEVAAIVFLGEERRLPVIPALDEVLGNPSEDESGSAYHGKKSRNSFQIPPSTPTVGKSYTDPIYSLFILPLQ